MVYNIDFVEKYEGLLNELQSKLPGNPFKARADALMKRLDVLDRNGFRWASLKYIQYVLLTYLGVVVRVAATPVTMIRLVWVVLKTLLPIIALLAVWFGSATWFYLSLSEVERKRFLETQASAFHAQEVLESWRHATKHKLTMPEGWFDDAFQLEDPSVDIRWTAAKYILWRVWYSHLLFSVAAATWHFYRYLGVYAEATAEDMSTKTRIDMSGAKMVWIRDPHDSTVFVKALRLGDIIFTNFPQGVGEAMDRHYEGGLVGELHVAGSPPIPKPALPDFVASVWTGEGSFLGGCFRSGDLLWLTAHQLKHYRNDLEQVVIKGPRAQLKMTKEAFPIVYDAEDVIVIRPKAWVYANLGLRTTNLKPLKSGFAGVDWCDANGDAWHTGGTLDNAWWDRFPTMKFHDISTASGCSGFPVIAGGAVVGLHHGFAKETRRNVCTAASFLLAIKEKLGHLAGESPTNADSSFDDHLSYQEWEDKLSHRKGDKGENVETSDTLAAKQERAWGIGGRAQYLGEEAGKVRVSALVRPHADEDPLEATGPPVDVSKVVKESHLQGESKRLCETFPKGPEASGACPEPNLPVPRRDSSSSLESDRSLEELKSSVSMISRKLDSLLAQKASPASTAESQPKPPTKSKRKHKKKQSVATAPPTPAQQGLQNP